MPTDYINVEFARLGESVATLALAPGSKVADLKREADLESVTIKRNGEALSDDAALVDGDKLLVVSKVEGGARK